MCFGGALVPNDNDKYDLNTEASCQLQAIYTISKHAAGLHTTLLTMQVNINNTCHTDTIRDFVTKQVFQK